MVFEKIALVLPCFGPGVKVIQGSSKAKYAKIRSILPKTTPWCHDRFPLAYLATFGRNSRTSAVHPTCTCRTPPLNIPMFVSILSCHAMQRSCDTYASAMNRFVN